MQVIYIIHWLQAKSFFYNNADPEIFRICRLAIKAATIFLRQESGTWFLKQG